SGIRGQASPRPRAAFRSPRPHRRRRSPPPRAPSRVCRDPWRDRERAGARGGTGPQRRSTRQRRARAIRRGCARSYTSGVAQALATAVGLGLFGLVATAVIGLRGLDLSRHISFGIFSTMVTLLAHSMMMFYFIGKGKAVKDAMSEGHLTGDHYQRIALARKPV